MYICHTPYNTFGVVEWHLNQIHSSGATKIHEQNNCVWLFYCHVINASKHQWFKITTILLMNLWVRNLGGTWQQIWLLLPIGVIHSADFNGGRAGLESLKSLHSHSVCFLSGTSVLHYLVSLSLFLSLSP